MIVLRTSHVLFMCNLHALVWTVLLPKCNCNVLAYTIGVSVLRQQAPAREPEHEDGRVSARRFFLRELSPAGLCRRGLRHCVGEGDTVLLYNVLLTGSRIKKHTASVLLLHLT